MADQIRVLIVDDIPETRDHLTKLLGFETDIEVVGAAASGREAIEMADELTPDVVLMDINMPDMDGISATEQLSAEVPTAAVVMMSVQGEADYLRRSMLAGAREFLVKPFSSDELTASIRQVYTREQEKLSRIAVHAAAPRRRRRPRPGRPTAARGGEPGRVVAVFGPKGGVGRTTLAVNLAVAAATELGQKTCLVDASFQFGDVGVLLNLNPKNKSIADLIPELEQGEPESMDTFVINHSAGIKVLLAPPSPEMAELITPTGAKRMIEALRKTTTSSSSTACPRSTTPPSPSSTRRHRPHDAVARDHVHQEHPPVPRGGGAAGVRLGQGPARPQSRRFVAGHPRRGRGALDRAARGSHDRLRRSQRRVRPQPGRAVLPQQS